MRAQCMNQEVNCESLKNSNPGYDGHAEESTRSLGEHLSLFITQISITMDK